MKKILIFLFLGMVTASVSAFVLTTFLEDGGSNNFKQQCLEARSSSAFYGVMLELSENKDLNFDKAYSEQRKIKCEGLFKHAKKLKKIKLSGLDLDDIEFLKFFPNVESVDVSHNNLKNWPSELLLRNLKDLNISHNKFYGTKTITRNVNIRKIDVSHNPLKRIGSLKKLKKLSYLNLKGTHITNYDDIEKFEHLKTVVLDNEHYKRARLPDHLKF